MRAAKLWPTLLSRHCCLSSASEGSLYNNAFRIKLSCASASPFSSSSVNWTSEHQHEFPPNSSITPISVNNRNPRNLEKLRIGEKPDGYRLEKAGKQFWNKLTLEITGKHVSASVLHHLGQKPVDVTTKEWCIKKYLYKTNDASAARLVGQVLAQRCLQTGITEVACFFPEEDRKKEKVALFLKAIEDAGVALSEPSQVPPDWYIGTWSLPETPWDVHEGVEDNVILTRKLRGFRERTKRFMRPNEMLKD